MSRIAVDVRLNFAGIGFDEGSALASAFAGVRRQVSAARDRIAAEGTEGRLFGKFKSDSNPLDSRPISNSG